MGNKELVIKNQKKNEKKETYINSKNLLNKLIKKDNKGLPT